MRSIPENNSGPQWNSKLLDDLAFIKKHLRYPFSKKTIPSAFIIVILLFGLSRIFFVTFYIQQRNAMGAGIGLAGMVIATAFAFYQYLRIIRFAVIPTPFHADENKKLVEKFLQSQQLATYTHPQAPEVFQIASRPLGNAKNEQREIMIFIADDKRILINSHFINQKFTLAPQSRNYKEMANRLKDWVKIHYPAGIIVQS